METILSGRIWKFGDNVNTDDITPSSYLTITDPNELAKCAMENLNPEFAGGVKKGDIIVAGRNFGCGSSREHAPVSLKAAGVSLVVAQSFARIFYRNAINLGLRAKSPHPQERLSRRIHYLRTYWAYWRQVA
jgi:3-isopropylmalate/(R)-2-methylmalate dehydratase small subunit